MKMMFDGLEIETGGGGMTQEEADERYLQLSGGTMTGNLVLSKHQSISGEEFDSIPKFLVYCRRRNHTGSPSTYEPKICFLEQSSVAFNLTNVRVVGVAAPENDNEAANKKYVDGAISAAITEAIEEAY